MLVAHETNTYVSDILNQMVKGAKLYIQSDYLAVGQGNQVTVYSHDLKDLLLPYITLSIPECDLAQSVWVIRRKYVGV